MAKRDTVTFKNGKFYRASRDKRGRLIQVAVGDELDTILRPATTADVSRYRKTPKSRAFLVKGKDAMLIVQRRDRRGNLVHEEPEF